MSGRRLLLLWCAALAAASGGCSLLFSLGQSDCPGERCDSCGRDGACCGTGSSLGDDFAGEDSLTRWVELYSGEGPALSVRNGSLLITAPPAGVTVGAASRSAVRLSGPSGRAVSVHLPAHAPSLGTNVILRSVSGEDYTFNLEQDGVHASSPRGGSGSVVGWADAAYVRFETSAPNLLHWRSSRDGESWQDVYFEPWVQGPAWLAFEVYGRDGVIADPFEIEGVNEELGSASARCSVTLLREEFDDDGPPATLVNRWNICRPEAATGELVLQNRCWVHSVLTYSMVDASVSVEATSEGAAGFAVVLANGAELALQWDDVGVEVVDEVGVLGRTDGPPGTVRFRHRDDVLYAEQLESATWTVVGSRPVADDLVSDVQLELYENGGGETRFDRLLGSTP